MDAEALRDFLDAYIVWRETAPVGNADLDKREHEAVRTLEFLTGKGAVFNELFLSSAEAAAVRMRAMLKEVYEMANWDGRPQRSVVIPTDGLWFAELCALLTESSATGRVYTPPAQDPAIEPLPDTQ